MKKPVGRKPARARTLVAINTRQLRTELGLSQEQLALTAGFHRTYVSQLERELANVSVDGLDKLAEALGVSAARLLAPATDPQT
jgi:transcriptional regulator with XRE-family HTH domain